MELIKKANGNIVRTAEEKAQMIEQAAEYYGKFLTALGFDWAADPHSANTPRRVAKAWVNDLIAGSINPAPEVTAFPNDEGYTGLICQTRIPVMSMCAHHNLTFSGVAHVAYIAGKAKTDMVIGLSKLNRIVDYYSRRPNIQESLTKQIHDMIDELCVGNRGVAVVIESQHNCVRCRGIKNDSVMKTSQMSGYFHTNEIGTRQEFFNLIDQSRY
jgi:GTP cyclohydrolase I